MSCPFCEIQPTHWLLQNKHAFAIRDRYPVSPGHSLIIPRRHVPTFFEATPDEQGAVMALVQAIKAQLDEELSPDGYNVGFNSGEAAGQTVMHLHVHVIPRRRGDVDDPRGGVRFVIPESGNYLRQGFIPRRRRPLALVRSVVPDSPATDDLERDRPAVLTTGGGADPFASSLLPLFSRASEIAIVAAFIQDSGVALLARHLLDASDRGARVRILTGDYLNITQGRALRHLLDLAGEEIVFEGGLAVEENGDEYRRTDEEPSARRHPLELRVVEVEGLAGTSRAFHPKAWIFLDSDDGQAFVGSSNLSRSALTDGVEWNLRIEQQRDPEGFSRLIQAFENGWCQGRIVDEAWLTAYALREARRDADYPLPPLHDDALPPPVPRDVQKEALQALRDARAEGRTRALVVLATGLGKTWLAAFDVLQWEAMAGRRPRVLFLAHRVELLRQGAETLRRLWPDLRVGWMAANQADTEGDVVFASVMKLSRKEHLSRIARDAFDYVIVDEVHHADARTWRRILDHLQPRFLLGLTATPERSDGGDILGLFDDFIAYRVDIGEGVARGDLVPFHYHGLKDVVDYAHIPWRNRRFDPEALAAAVQTGKRMERLWQAWGDHPGARSLIFCCSIPHARYVADWLSARGVRVEAVHSGPGSVDRDQALASLAAGKLDALCAVDLFNEGIDVPAVDRVVMLRPTESTVLFLQQLGRGLRVSEDKAALTVLDFVGNHRIFLDRVRILLNLVPADRAASLHAFLQKQQSAAMPPGCSMDIELEAIALLARLLPAGDRNGLVRTYREIRDSRGERPSLGEIYRRGLNPRSLKAFGGWFNFVAAEDDLTEIERHALQEATGWLTAVEVGERMTRSFKMVVLEALLEDDALHDGITIETLSARSRAILERSPELARDLEPTQELPDPTGATPEAFQAYWLRWPLAHWAGEGRPVRERPWFRVHEGRFEPIFAFTSEVRAAVTDMTREVVDYRLAQYRRRRRSEVEGRRGFEVKVLWNQRDPILKLPDRARFPNLPLGDIDVCLPDGAQWRFRFMKIACNVAHPVGSNRNALPDLMYRWFGIAAGRPGTEFRVRFFPSPDGWQVEPAAEGDATILPLPGVGRLLAFPSLKAAAGWEASLQGGEALEREEIALPGVFDEGVFAARASGRSMDGWRSEIRDGDWLVLRWARGHGLGAIEGRVALIARGSPIEGQSFHLKRVVRTGAGVELRSDSPEVPSMAALPEDTVVALLVKAIHPEQLGPDRGALLPSDGIGEAFGVSEMPRSPWGRVDGHLFVLLDGLGSLTAPDRAGLVVEGLRPSETAFVLARSQDGDGWRYLGVGRWDGGERQWIIPEVDFAVWRALGTGRTASRRLDERWLDAAREHLGRLEADVAPGTWIEARGTRLRFLGSSAKGGARIDGGPGGFAARTVSIVDVAWALAARAETARSAVPPDEAWVNRLRYLDGTPKGSTRWIDTGWALCLTEGAAPVVRD